MVAVGAPASGTASLLNRLNTGFLASVSGGNHHEENAVRLDLFHETTFPTSRIKSAAQLRP